MCVDDKTDPKPKLIIFDLDDTLWPFHVDWTVEGPFSKRNGKVYDATGLELKPYPGVIKILDDLLDQGYVLGAASRTTMPEYSEQLLNFYGWNKYFTYKEIYPSSKIKHFQKFHKDSGIAYQDMLFFDDEYRNIKDLQPYGVTCIYIKSGGLTKELLNQGFSQFAKNKGR